MTSRQENKLDMYLVVYAFLIAKAAILSNLPRYAEFLAAFFEGITKIKLLNKEQMFDKSGVNKNKMQLKLVLATLAADISRKLAAFAKFTNNLLLLSEISFTESKLKYSNSSQLLKFAQGIYDRAQTFINELESYSITPETQATLLAAINNFADYTSQPRIVKASGKRYTAEMAETFKITDEALANIDTCLEIIKLKEAGTYSEYKTVKKIIPLGKGSFVLIGQITDADTKEPVKKAKIVLSPKSSGNLTVSQTNGTIVKISAHKGGFAIKSLPNGIYNVVITKNGYVEQKTTIAITNGELSKLNVELVKNKE